ncbi:MAG: ECF-type sigma factor [Planctomycetota bacterium]
MTNRKITDILNLISGGDRAAVDDLIPLVYEHMKRIAANHAKTTGSQNYDPTELVHETYMRMIGDEKLAWKSRSHFFGACANVIRRILVDQARAQSAKKRGGGNAQITWDDNLLQDRESLNVIDLDDALLELQSLAPRQVQLIELRYFGGMSEIEAAEVLNISRRTVTSDWAMAKAWLKTRLK